jgi:hypothetical protein
MRARLAPTPQPVRNHPYWKGAGQEPDAVRMQLRGAPPRVTRWHHEWRDYEAIMAHLDHTIADAREVLVVHAGATPCSLWLARHHACRTRFVRHDRLAEEDLGAVDVGYVFLEASRWSALVRAVDWLRSRAGEVVIHVRNDIRADLPELVESLRPIADGRELRVHHAGSRFRSRAARARALLRRPQGRVSRRLAQLGLAALQVGTFLDNRRSAEPPGRQVSSSTVLIRRT